MVEKLKRVRIETPEGPKFITFRPVTELPEGKKIACDCVCPYGGKVCSRLKDPSAPDDPESTFMDFCANLGDDLDEKNRVLATYMPSPGTLEENLPDWNNVYNVLIKENGYVRVTDVIDSACSDTCPMYDPEHSKCSPENRACLLQDLLKNKNFNPNALKEMKEKSEDEDATMTAG